MASFSSSLEQALRRALQYANERSHEYATLEHLLLSLLDDRDAAAVMRACDVDIDLLRDKLTGYLEWLVQTQLADVLEVVTPTDPARRGAQLSIRVLGGRERGRALFEHLMARGVIGDWREPDVIRISPAPLYNRYADCLAFAEAVRVWRRSG